MSNLWFTSDLHLGHRAVAYDRRYGGWPKDRSLITPEDVTWHDTMLAENWDAVVDKDDVVWVLGDLIANPNSLTMALEWIEARPGVKHLILGNHDPAHPMNRDGWKWLYRYRPAFASVQQSARRRIDGQEVLLSHFPYMGDGDGKGDRDQQWRLLNLGVPILHGHVHSKHVITHSCVPGGNLVKQIHVGLDAWDYTPVSLDQVVGLLA